MSEIPTEGNDYGTALFGACYFKYFTKKREAQAEVMKQIRAGKMNDRPYTDEERAIATRALMRMGTGSTVGGVSMYLLRTFQKRYFRTAPSFVLTGALVAAGSIGGAFGSIYWSNYFERQNMQSQPLIVAERYCPAYLEFAPCVDNQDCLEATSKDATHQRLLSGYYQCKSRGAFASE